MTESSFVDQGYWVSPFEELALQEDAGWDETQGTSAVDPGSGSDPAGGMLAFWYGPGFHGSPTASGEPFDPYGFTAAHPTLPFGTELMVSYGGTSVPVRINDRGLFDGERELDLSEGAAQALGLTQAGVDYVEISYPGSSEAVPNTPAVNTPFPPANLYEPNLPVNVQDEGFIPQGEEPGSLYDDYLDV